jgi:hypothetical protein
MTYGKEIFKKTFKQKNKIAQKNKEKHEVS